MRPARSSVRHAMRSRVADWHWEHDPDDLLDGLPSEALAILRQLAHEITVRDSMVFLDGATYTG